MTTSRKVIAGTTASVAALGLAATALLAAPAANAATGTKSLAGVLTSGKVGLDHNAKDYDIVTAAVLAVLKAKPNSSVKVLTDGNVALTAFIPNDKAFEILASDLTGKHVTSEKKAFKTIAGLGIDTVETVLLYHVVPGATITAKQALKANGAALKSAQGATIKVGVAKKPLRIVLRDKDTNSRNPRVILNQANINKGNKQVAHGIDRVLRPVDLPPAAK